MKGIIDRIEENIAVVEVDENMYDVDISNCEEELKEGDCVEITIENDEIISIRKDEQETIDRKKYIEELTKDMWQ